MALAMGWMFGSSVIYHMIAGESSHVLSVDYANALIDTTTCVAMVLIALKANRNYTLWMAGFQIIAFFAHVARAVADNVSPIAYLVLSVGPSYFQIIILGFGIWFHHRRVKRHGNYRSWQNSSARSPAEMR